MAWFDKLWQWRILATENELLNRRVVDLEKQLADEQFRNRCRENELTDRILTAAGRAPLTPDPHFQTPRQPSPKAPLSAMDEARLVALRQAAVQAGRPSADGDRAFEAQRNGQPFSLNLPSDPYFEPS